MLYYYLIWFRNEAGMYWNTLINVSVLLQSGRTRGATDFITEGFSMVKITPWSGPIQGDKELSVPDDTHDAQIRYAIRWKNIADQ